MDGFGIALFVIALALYYFTHKGFFLFLAGLGAGLVAGLVYAYMLVQAL